MSTARSFLSSSIIFMVGARGCLHALCVHMRTGPCAAAGRGPARSRRRRQSSHVGSENTNKTLALSSLSFMLLSRRARRSRRDPQTDPLPDQQHARAQQRGAGPACDRDTTRVARYTNDPNMCSVGPSHGPSTAVSTPHTRHITAFGPRLAGTSLDACTSSPNNPTP